MDNPVDIATGLGLFKAALYLLMFAVLVVTGHGLWRSSKDHHSHQDDCE